MALLILNQEINNLEGVKKVLVYMLGVMTSGVGWYLLIFACIHLKSCRLYLCCQELLRLIPHLQFSGLFICSFIMEIWSQLERMTCSCMRYVSLNFQFLCRVGFWEWGMWEDIESPKCVASNGLENLQLDVVFNSFCW